MASADYSVGTKVTADVSNFEKGMNKAEKSLKGFSDKLANSIDRLGKKGLIGSVANVTLAMQGLTKSFNTVIKFAKDVGKAINECTEAYKGQIIAERALDIAIQNNPFISGESSKALKQFASDMQRVSNYGDEELIPMMTNLVSLGRTEAETMQIMSVAMDMSAGMGISLDTAITQLNATLNGNIGRLGQQNAELKDLTEEELKQGKAIEILGEKFKGLSSATADTSKQLQNIKGDFKEALGQFTLPSSDMWNKFWAGFYERGIEVLKKLDDYLDINTVGKKIFENIQDEAKKIAKSKKLKIGDVLGDFNFISEQLSGLSEKELSVLKKSLEGIKDRTDIEQYWLNMVSKRLHNIELEADQERANAKAESERAKAEEERLAREKELAELKKKQAEEREKQLKVENQWQDKILSQQISILEKEKESAVAGAEERGEATYEVERYYNEKILALKLQQIEKNREEALNAENVTEEARLAINLYYDNEITKAKQEEEKKRYKAKKEELEEEEKEEKKTLSVIIKMAQEVTKKVADTIKNVFSKIKTVFNKALDVFKFNPDEALNSLLAIEDAILTFFVETLPQLPKFFASAVESIIKLLQIVLTYIDFDDISNIIESIIKSIGTLLTSVARFINQNSDKLTSGVTQLVKTVIDGVAEWIESGGWKELLDAILTIQKAIEDAVAENLPALVDTIIDALPDLIEFLKNSIISASKTLGKIAKPIFKAIIAIIMAIIELLNDDDVIDQMVETFAEIIEGLIEAIIEMLPRFLTKTAPKVIKMIQRSLVRLPIELGVAFIKGLVKAFINTDWGAVVRDMFTGFIDSIKDFFGIHSPSTLFESFGEFMIEGLWNGIKNMGSWLNENVGGFFSNLWEGIKNVFSGVGDWFGNVFSGAKEKIKSAFSGIGDWFGTVFRGAKEKVLSAFEGIGDWFGNVFKGAKDKITSAFEGMGNWASGVWDKIKGGFSNVGGWFSTTFSGAASAIQNAFSGLGDWFNGLWNNIKSGASSVGDAIGGAVSKAGDWLGDVGEGIWDWGSSVGEDIQDAFEGIGDWFEDVGDSVSDWVDSWKWWATGTNVAPKGLAVVGEAGPELVRFNGGEQVLNTRNTQKALANMGGTTINQNVTFNNLQDTSAFTMIQQLKQYNRQLAINGIV